MHMILFLIIGLTSGWLAGKIVKGRGFGIAGDMIIGTLGSIMGGFLFGRSHGVIGSIVVATIGAIILLALVRILKRT